MDDYSNPQYLKRQFDAYLEGRLPEQQALALLEYLKEQPDPELTNELIYQALHAPVATDAQDAYTSAILQQTRQELLAQTQPSKKSVIPLWKKLAGAAAVLLVGFVAVLALETGMFSNTVTALAAHGTQREITLPDGSRIWLDAGTKLSYPKQYDGKARTLELVSGQIFLNVKHKPSQPFVVTAKGVDITVLGTSFEVRAFDNEADVRVAVASGKVGVQPQDRSTPAVMLLPKEQVVFNHSKQQMIVKETDPAAVAQWREQVLFFNQEPLKYVFSALERKYNVVIDVPESLNASPLVTASFKDQSLDEVLGILAFSNGFTYQLNNNKEITIRKPKYAK